MRKAAYEPLASRLRTYRLQCGLTQKEVAKIIGINRSSYTYYERGSHLPNIINLLKLCRIFGIEVTDLISSDDVDLDAFYNIKI